jgi:hypothetical protein
MSLKGFHIVFIILSILLTAGFAYWSIANETAVPVGIGSAVLSVVLVVYGIFFIKKSRNIIT